MGQALFGSHRGRPCVTGAGSPLLTSETQHSRDYEQLLEKLFKNIENKKLRGPMSLSQ